MRLMCKLILAFTFCLLAFQECKAQYRSYGSTGYYRSSYPYTYSYPSYYGYGYTYYRPYTYKEPYCPPTTTPTLPVPASRESTTDKMLKELLLRKLLAEQMGVPAPVSTGGAHGAPLALTTPATGPVSPVSPLTAEELAQLRDVLKILREKSVAAPVEKKE